MNTKKIASILMVISLTATSLLFSSCTHTHKYGEEKVSEPTCLAQGFNYHLCEYCGYLECTSEIAPVGHSFTVWKDDIRKLKKVSACDYCGFLTEDANYSEPASIPRLYAYGTPNGDEVRVECRYETTLESKFYGMVKLDSNLSNSFYKKNYDLFVFTNDTNQIPMNVTFADSMGSNSAYAIKAEYIDKTSVRNLSASRLWYEAIKTRNNLPVSLKTLPFLGADGGYPIIFYTNDNFNGIYNLCLPNNKLMFNLSSDRSALIYTYTAFGEMDFRYSAGVETYVPCTVVFPESKTGKESARTKFENFMDFVNNSSDVDFKENIHKYMDVNAAIDYLLCVYMFGADNNIVECCNWVSYDGNVFIPSLYNLTLSFGIDNSGYLKEAENTLAPRFENGLLRSGTKYVLWEKLCAVFSDEIFERYTYLRNNVLTEDKVEEVFKNNLSAIKPEIYEAEFEEYRDKKLMDCPETAEQIRTWYSEKCAILDNVLLKK